MAIITGGCLCGKIRYSTDAEPKFVSLCHCRDCQKFTGSAFAVVIGLPKAAVTITGTLEGFTKRGDSGKPIERRFCPDCGASIMDEAEALPGIVMIQAGTLDDPSWVKPTTEIYCASAQPWARFGAQTPMKRFDKAPGYRAMAKRLAIALYVPAMIAVVVGVDIAFFRSRFWERLIANIGIVLVFAAFFWRFFRGRDRPARLDAGMAKRSGPA